MNEKNESITAVCQNKELKITKTDIKKLINSA